MSYSDIAEMAADAALTDRLIACAAQELPIGVNPPWWVSSQQRTWVLCAAPGWDAAWASAKAGNVENPGNDPGVITDGQILASVQKAIADEEAVKGEVVSQESAP